MFISAFRFSGLFEFSLSYLSYCHLLLIINWLSMTDDMADMAEAFHGIEISIMDDLLTS